MVTIMISKTIPPGRTLVRALALPALLLLAGACAEPAREAPPAAPTEAAPAAGLGAATLELRAAESEGDDALVDLHFTRGDKADAPRMMELRLRLNGLRYVSAEALSAATAAGKEVVVQDDEGVLRTVVFATSNLNRLDTGPLVRYRLAKVGFADPAREASAGKASVEIQSLRPVFAPPEADIGVTLGAPLDLGGP
jgi:hypothetical protein